MSDHRFLSNSLTNSIHAHCKAEFTLLNLGCGIGWHMNNIPAKNQLHVDVWLPYLEQIKHEKSVIKLDIRDLSIFIDKSWDVVSCIDVIEHLEKDDAMKAIKEMERIARKVVILYTPAGFEKQEDGHGWGSGNPEYQKHRCGFTVREMLELGYTSHLSREVPPGQLCVKKFG
jgi:ubiquinone/menaquinone biosynthesis C-methylase UbiE